jgi:hypothetical protein
MPKLRHLTTLDTNPERSHGRLTTPIICRRQAALLPEQVDARRLRRPLRWIVQLALALRRGCVMGVPLAVVPVPDTNTTACRLIRRTQ